VVRVKISGHVAGALGVVSADMEREGELPDLVGPQPGVGEGIADGVVLEIYQRALGFVSREELELEA